MLEPPRTPAGAAAKMKIAAAQMDIVWHNREANHAKAREMARLAVEAGADLLLLPEMFATGFSMDTVLTAEEANGPTPGFIRALARETGLVVLGGFVLKQKNAAPQNVCLAVRPDGSDLGLYAKIHQIALLGEDRHYAPGKNPVPFGLPGVRAACVICYDLRFPELFRALAHGCGLLLVIASWPSARQRQWDVLLPARAVENQAYVAGVNRVGEGGGLLFTGGSAIISPSGETLAKAGAEETLLVAEIDLGELWSVRSSLPFLKDRKPLAVQAAWEAAACESRRWDPPEPTG